MPFIYKITNTVNNKAYIGKTTQLKRRIADHVNKLQKCKHHSECLQSDWNMYGEASFTYEIVEKFDSVFNFDADNLEKYWIKIFNSTNPNSGYNQQAGGSRGPGYRFTESQKKNVSEGMKGRKFSEYTRKAIKESKMKPIKDSNGVIYESTMAAAIKLGINRSSIKEILAGRNRKTKAGLSFTFLKGEV